MAGLIENFPLTEAPAEDRFIIRPGLTVDDLQGQVAASHEYGKSAAQITGSAMWGCEFNRS